MHSSTRSRLLAAVVVLVAVAGLIGVLSSLGTGYASPAAYAAEDRPDRDDPRDERRAPRSRTLTVDVAENGHTFSFDEAPVIDDGPLAGAPAYGNAFVTTGYIYPEGTLDGTDGVNPDGSPEFPDEVIGEWLCKGYFIGADGMGQTEGAMVYSTQTFAFGDDPQSGGETIVVTGYEGAEVGTPVSGAITGGTGDHALVRGEAVQTLIGVNNAEDPTMGIDKRVTFNLGR